jgi:hypothetical protein
MAKSFFTDKNGQWKGESKRTTLWWGITVLGALIGGVLGSLLPIPVIGTLIGVAIGGYIGAVIHHKLCEDVLAQEGVDPVISNVSSFANHVRAAGKGVFAGVKAWFSGKNDAEAQADTQDAHDAVINRAWLTTTFSTGPRRQADKALTETKKFFRHVFHI